VREVVMKMMTLLFPLEWDFDTDFGVEKKSARP
jgi:hypothetical protein